MSDDYKQNAVDPLADKGELSMYDAADQLFGSPDVPHSGRLIAEQVEIMSIQADIRQPRRAIPSVIRGEWQGDAGGVAELLQKWQYLVGLDGDTVASMFKGNGDGSVESITGKPILDGFVSLCGLSSSILRDGLTNPITIVPHFGGMHLIETGERRWLAHHLLLLYGHDEYKTMAARVVKRLDVYRQASENGNRRPLNAIEMARQLALLIMDVHAHKHEFETWEICVAADECDRNYYAQVAKGNQWKITGHGQRILDVTGLKSIAQISQYRALLKIPDELWIEADENDWTEFKIREIDQDRRGVKVDDTLTGVKVDGDDVHRYSKGEAVETADGLGVVTSVATQYDRDLGIYVDVDGSNLFYGPDEIKLYALKDWSGMEHELDRRQHEKDRLEKERRNLDQLEENMGVPLGSEPQTDDFAHGFKVGDCVQTVHGEGDVIEVFPNFVVVQIEGEDDPRQYYPGVDRIIIAKKMSGTGDRKTVVDGDDDFWDSGPAEATLKEILETDVYVPETHEDATPMISIDQPKLALLVKALDDYYQDNDAIPEDEIGWVLEQLQEPMGAIELEMGQSMGQFDRYQSDMRLAKKVMRSYLEKVTDHIEGWIDNMVGFAAECHVEEWESDDYDDGIHNE